jgi:hypothetical protein
LRRFKTPDGKLQTTFDPLPDVKAPQIVQDATGHLVARR